MRLVAFALALLLPASVAAGQGVGGPSLRNQVFVSTEWLAGRLAEKEAEARKKKKDDKKPEKTVMVVHVARDRAHYDAGHIPGAVFLQLGDILRTRDGVPNELPEVGDLQRVFERIGIGNTRRVVLYGDASGLSAARAFFTLDHLGHGDRASILNGGLEAWRAEQRPVSTEPVEATAAQFAPRVRYGALAGPDLVNHASYAAKSSASPDAVLVDARSPEDYAGSDGKGGHIPGARNAYWVNTLVSKEQPVLRRSAELRQQFEAAGAATGRRVIVYCGTGVQASWTYAVAKHLGYNVSLFDESFSGWSATPGNKAATGPKP